MIIFQYVDLSDYVISGTWDVIDCPGFIRRFRGNHLTPNRTRIDFKIVLRRKTLFYTVNLIIPCVLISLLSICVFYLPADEGEKMTLSISILLALVVFLLLLQKILPPTSTSIPLIASYLLFTMILNVFSILITVVIINCSFRTPRTHTMPQWVYTLFIERLSKLLLMSHRPKTYAKHHRMSFYPSQTRNITVIENELDTFIKQTTKSSPGPTANFNFEDGAEIDIDLQPERTHYKQRKKIHRNITASLKGIPTTSECNLQGTSLQSKQQTKLQTGKEREKMIETKTIKSQDNTAGNELEDSTIDDIWVSMEDQLEQMLGTQQDKQVVITHELYKSVKAIRYIARHTRQSDAHDAVLKDWKYIGLVMDRLLLVIFLFVTISGTLGIFMESPHIFDFVDQQKVIDRLTSKGQAI